MTWAEFQLRSFAYWEDHEAKVLLEAKTAYKIYCLGFLFGKKRPETFKKFTEREYGITLDPDSAVGQEKIDAMKAAWEQYKKEKNGA